MPKYPGPGARLTLNTRTNQADEPKVLGVGNLTLLNVTTSCTLRHDDSIVLSTCVQSYILDLPDEFRTVILLHDLEGLTAGEIAGMLGLTLANAKMRLHRARASLKAALQAGCSLSCDCRGAIVCEPKSIG